ncbi:MAG: LLM class flavin-dependent oxidoreductase [Acidimicrobiales bacterium]|jgi:alkanesulfonate monooxygenase SsuD/methylene tetrahydromethanopterin reductase-like flavin-dependent oxidoreductase (luciferase family)
MQFGLFDQLEHPGDRTPLGQLYSEHIDLVVRAEEAGFVRYHKSEHHMVALDAAPSINLFLAALTQRTSSIRLCSLVHLLPFYEPFRLFEELCMLDQLSNGRLEIGYGKGVSPPEHLLWGLDISEAVARTNESLDIILSAMRQASEAPDLGSRFTYSGDFWSYEAAPLQIAPAQSPHPPMWRPGTRTTAAELGLSTIIPLPISMAGDAIREFRATQQPGLDPTREPVLPVMRRVVIADTDAEAESRARAAWAALHLHLSKLFYEYELWPDNDPTFGGDFDMALSLEAVVVGSPDTVRAHFEQLDADPDITDSVICVSWGDLSAAEYMRSLNLFIEHVMPAMT